MACTTAFTIATAAPTRHPSNAVPRIVLHGIRAGALSLAGEAAVHVQQFAAPFHSVRWIGPLFLANVVATVTVIAAVALPRTRQIAALAGVVISALALGGLVVSYGGGFLGWQKAGLRTPVARRRDHRGQRRGAAERAALTAARCFASGELMRWSSPSDPTCRDLLSSSEARMWSAQALKPWSLRRPLVSIVMGLDQHLAQITGDWLNTETGEVQRARVAPADRAGVRRFLERFDGRELELALEATTGWRFVVEELRRIGAGVHLAEPAETAGLRGPKKRARAIARTRGICVSC